MRSIIRIFWSSSIVLLIATGYDIFQYGTNKLNMVVLVALLSTALLAKISNRAPLRALLLILMLIPVVSVRSLSFLHFNFSEDLETTLVLFVLMTGFMHCTFAGRALMDGE